MLFVYEKQYFSLHQFSIILQFLSRMYIELLAVPFHS